MAGIYRIKERPVEGIEDLFDEPVIFAIAQMEREKKEKTSAVMEYIGD
jgi:hypothetical protein